MSTGQAATVGEFGVPPEGRLIRKCFNRSGAALAVGEIAQVNLALAGAETTKYGTDSDGAWRNLVAIDAVGVATGHVNIGMALEAVADDAEGKFMFYGITPVAILVLDTGAGVETDPGDPVYAVAGQQELDVGVSAGARCCGYVVSTITANPIANPVKVFFDGLNYLGNQ